MDLQVLRASSAAASRSRSTTSACARRSAKWFDSTETAASTAGSGNVCKSACPRTLSVMVESRSVPERSNRKRNPETRPRCTT
ncbi:unnamed protein product [Larinioides sclopetarius]|uniref:Uncharacterized protein n=1 Tax=Larinioides sclopetarius TaxID=280406 RepID=A0AAV2AR11_9ARAC